MCWLNKKHSDNNVFATLLFLKRTNNFYISLQRSVNKDNYQSFGKKEILPKKKKGYSCKNFDVYKKNIKFALKTFEFLL